MGGFNSQLPAKLSGQVKVAIHKYIGEGKKQHMPGQAFFNIAAVKSLVLYFAKFLDA